VSEAREALAKYKIKVVVSDYRMPDISGTQFLQEVKGLYPDTVKILFTGYTDFSAAEEAINVGKCTGLSVNRGKQRNYCPPSVSVLNIMT